MMQKISYKEIFDVTKTLLIGIILFFTLKK